MTIGKRIQIRREELGLTQEELAHKIGYKSKSSINKIELDIQQLKQSKIKEIAEALDTTPSYIMGWVEDEAEEKPSGKVAPVLSAVEEALILSYRAAGEGIKESVAKLLDVKRVSLGGSSAASAM